MISHVFTQYPPGGNRLVFNDDLAYAVKGDPALKKSYNSDMANIGRKLDLALKSASAITDEVINLQSLLAKMTDKQKLIFQSLVQGKTELEAIIVAGTQKDLSFKVPFVLTTKGRKIKTINLKIKHLSMLKPKSLNLLNTVAQSQVKAALGSGNYKDFILKIDWFFKLFALDAARVILNLMNNAKSEQIQLHAAQDILNRAGYTSENKESSEPVMPVNVIIRYDKKPVAENIN